MVSPPLEPVPCRLPTSLGLNLLQSQLNQAIEKEVGRASEGGKYGIYFAQGVATATDGHTACDSDPAINLVSTSGTSLKPESLHPNVAGYERIGARLRLFLASEDFTFTGTGTYQVGQQLSFCPKVALLGDEEVRDKLPRLELGANPQDTVTEMQLASCDYGVVYITGMLPGSSADISIHSTPTLLATLTANSEGIAEGVVMIPGGFAPGQHTLVAEGLDADGKPFSSSASRHGLRTDTVVRVGLRGDRGCRPAGRRRPAAGRPAQACASREWRTPNRSCDLISGRPSPLRDDLHPR